MIFIQDTRVWTQNIYFLYFGPRGRRLCWNVNESERSIQALDICLFIRLTEQSVNHHLREFNIPKKNTNELDPARHIVGNHRIRGQKKIPFIYSDPGGTLENKLNDLKPLFSRKKSLTFRKRSKKMLLHWIANLADQNIKQQQLKINMHVTYHTVLSVWNKPLIDTSQHCSTSRANQALRSLANEGFVCKRFLHSLPPPPTFIFWLLFHCSRGQNLV